MTLLLQPSPNLRPVYREGRLAQWERACSRCGTFRTVRNPRAKRNLCQDCVAVLTEQEIARWAA